MLARAPGWRPQPRTKRRAALCSGRAPWPPPGPPARALRYGAGLLLTGAARPGPRSPWSPAAPTLCRLRGEPATQEGVRDRAERLGISGEKKVTLAAKILLPEAGVSLALYAARGYLWKTFESPGFCLFIFFFPKVYEVKRSLVFFFPETG